MAWRVICWPYAIFWDLFRGPVSAWFFRPVDARKARADQLREDARSWRSKQHSGTEDERLMAVELARICEDMAREVDL